MIKEPGLPPSPQELADQLAIQEVLNQHSRALDRLQEQWLKSCYWQDAEVDYGAYKGPAHTFAELIMGALGSQYQLTRHNLSNTTILLEGETALCESYVYASHLLADGSEDMNFHGRYLDKLEKRDGAWKMRYRQVVVDWVVRHPGNDERDSDAFKALARGSNDQQDPLHALLQGA
jgi:SnoaL-like domain